MLLQQVGPNQFIPAPSLHHATHRGGAWGCVPLHVCGIDTGRGTDYTVTATLNHKREIVAMNLHPPLVIRKVLFNEARGIYLGSGVWSRDPGVTANVYATTVADAEEAHCLTARDAYGTGKPFPDYSLREVHPSIQGTLATAHDCINAMLPGW